MNLNFLHLSVLLLLPMPWLWFFIFQKKFQENLIWPSIYPELRMNFPFFNHLKEIEGKQLKNKASQRDKINHSRPLIKSIIFSLLILALAQPITQKVQITEEKALPVDVVLVVDTALSMSLNDYKIGEQVISRMSLSKILLTDFVEHFTGQKLSLVTLDTPPAIWLPFTNDKQVVQHAISRLTPLLGSRTSDLGATFELVKNQLESKALISKTTHQPAEDKQTEKIIVVITDGSTQIGSISPNEAIKSLAEHGHHLYLIAIGSKSADANLDNLKTQSTTQLIYEPSNVDALEKLAKLGKGEFFHAIDANIFTQALKHIESRYQRKIVISSQFNLTDAWYPLPLSFAMLLTLLVFFDVRNSVK